MRETTNCLCEWPRQCALSGRSRDRHQGEPPHGFHMRQLTPQSHPVAPAWVLGTHNQRGDAKRSIDATPALFGEIDDNEDITREKWVQGVTQLARVSNGTPQSRQETSEAQPMEIELRPVLLMSERATNQRSPDPNSRLTRTSSSFATATPPIVRFVFIMPCHASSLAFNIVIASQNDDNSRHNDDNVRIIHGV